MADYEKAVFISYAWGGECEEIFNLIDQAFQKRGIKIIRDRRDLGYKGSIREFMERIGHGSCIILVIDDTYLRSPNCMYELVEIAEEKQFYERVFPVILGNANLYEPLRRIEYIKYWEDKREQLAAAIKTLDPANLQGIREEMDLYDRIRDKVSGLTGILSDMNTLTPEMHRDSEFTELYQAVQWQMNRNREALSAPEEGSTPQFSRPRSDVTPAFPLQNINIQGGQFSGPVQFGSTTQQIGSVQNIYYIDPAVGKAGSGGMGETTAVEYFEPETVPIPEGSFLMGSEPGVDVPDHETPRHQVFLPAYRIGKYPVTNMQYELFVRETRRSIAPEMGWDGRKIPAGTENYPVAAVTWYDAQEYCQWLSQKTGRSYSLPNEAQWEKACRGGQDGIFPWGDQFDPARCNLGRAEAAPVDRFPAQNDYGCFDLVGNVRQWTCTLWGEKHLAPDPLYAYPWRNDGRNDIHAGRHIRRVVRGGASKDNILSLRCSTRYGQVPTDIGLPGTRSGFRIILTK